MEEFVEQALLYDFYGELLTEHQKDIYEDFIMNNLSVSEIADAQEISRQGVHDMVKRCRNLLDGYEKKLHLVERFLSVKEKIAEIDCLLKDFGLTDNPQEESSRIARVRELTDRILEEL